MTHEEVKTFADAEVGELVSHQDLLGRGRFYVGPGVQKASWYGDDRCAVGERIFARTGVYGDHWRRVR